MTTKNFRFEDEAKMRALLQKLDQEGIDVHVDRSYRFGTFELTIFKENYAI